MGCCNLSPPSSASSEEGQYVNMTDSLSRPFAGSEHAHEPTKVLFKALRACATASSEPSPPRIVKMRGTDNKHDAYIKDLEMPTPSEFASIAQKQEQKERDIDRKYGKGPLVDDDGPGNSREEARAAGTIQRNYRGYRERRQLNGMRLDPSTRWMEAIKEARYRNLTTPTSRKHQEEQRRKSTDTSQSRGDSHARDNWKLAAHIARWAASDDPADPSIDEGLTEVEVEDRRRRKLQEKREREKSAKLMDLQYFLEMVDQKHRYGSNLRTYHQVWLNSGSHENFFYWLDHGEGKNVSLQLCSREQLDREQVRYLSKEERQNYLVKVDKEGRLCWAKNGVRIDTSIKYKDSINGIVPETDDTPPFKPTTTEVLEAATSHDTSTEEDSESSESDLNKHSDSEASDVGGSQKTAYVTTKHFSATALLNHLLRKSVKKNTWIFVADTSFRLYVGIKQSGAFQHSSFLNGARISAAGLIKIKDGQLRSLSPLSGHYRPPVANFRAFVHSLKAAGVDMSRVSISKSYGILVGLEGYVKTRRKIKHGVDAVVHHKDHKERALREEEQERRLRDESKSRLPSNAGLDGSLESDQNQKQIQSQSDITPSLGSLSITDSTEHNSENSHHRLNDAENEKSRANPL